MNDLEIVWMMCIEDNIAEIAAWANKQGQCIVVYHNNQGLCDETVYTISAAAMIGDFDDD